MIKLTVVIPTFNELSLNYLSNILETARDLPSCEIICVDRSSSDGTKELLKHHNVTLIQTDQNTRAARLNLGINAARGDLILLQHPRTLLPREAYVFLIENSAHLKWGGFIHSFDHNHWLLKFTSWYSNNIRPKIQKIIYLDHCIFIHKTLLTKLGPTPVPEVDIFEDTELCKRLRVFARPQILPLVGKTSAIRFIKSGILQQAAKNQFLKWGYYCGVDSKTMNRLYEKSFSLNSKYEDSTAHKDKPSSIDW